jgi:hypothetical protein
MKGRLIEFRLPNVDCRRIHDWQVQGDFAVR